MFLVSHTGTPKVGGVVWVWRPVPPETQAPSLFLPQQFDSMNSMLMVTLGFQDGRSSADRLIHTL